MSRCPVQHHGMTKAQGCSQSRLGSFSKLFPDLKPLHVTEEQARLLGGKDSPMHDKHGMSSDSDVPSGYTFFAQFVDHDITLDTKTDLHGSPLSNGEINDLPNLRSPNLDLDCLYGFGPEASPHLYYGETARGKLREGNSHNHDDLPRSEYGAALIGDPRNDENIFVSQIQLLFIRFHNRIYDTLISKYSGGDRFEEAQKIVRHHYQYIVVEDFLKRICDKDIYNFAIQRAKNHAADYPLVYSTKNYMNFPMPVEFSVGAFRFGHTTVRNNYAANGSYTEVDLFDDRFGTEGFASLPRELVVDWRFLLEVDPCICPQMTKGFNLLLADELICMPDAIVGRHASDNERSLAFRNILRGNALALASGQDIAKALKAAGYPISTAFSKLKMKDVIPNDCDTGDLIDHTPLFFYLMREAEILGNGKNMGPVGSAIILEVFLGILLNCESSYLKHPGWKPLDYIAGDTNLELGDIVRFVRAKTA